jgi:hypothetical protein
MNTQEIARELGTEPKLLRRFLRSPESTFQAVGSGGRYDFTEKELPDLKRRFKAWADKQTKPAVTKRSAHAKTRRTTDLKGPDPKDVAVWNEEGEVRVPDIRDPQVLAQVRMVENNRAASLDARLMAAGLHLSQWNGADR